ncbi:hypothetical protein GY45DRAFT_924885 [Cubamyces sp. BRFM 1775]|nr:hypothetical protein GY45DRAFT_924885 [Cubamyces sp. BRFM 1775]
MYMQTSQQRDTQTRRTSRRPRTSLQRPRRSDRLGPLATRDLRLAVHPLVSTKQDLSAFSLWGPHGRRPLTDIPYQTIGAFTSGAASMAPSILRMCTYESPRHVSHRPLRDITTATAADNDPVDHSRRTYSSCVPNTLFPCFLIFLPPDVPLPSGIVCTHRSRPMAYRPLLYMPPCSFSYVAVARSSVV